MHEIPDEPGFGEYHSPSAPPRNILQHLLLPQYLPRAVRTQTPVVSGGPPRSLPFEQVGETDHWESAPVPLLRPTRPDCTSRSGQKEHVWQFLPRSPQPKLGPRPRRRPRSRRLRRQPPQFRRSPPSRPPRLHPSRPPRRRPRALPPRAQPSHPARPRPRWDGLLARTGYQPPSAAPTRC